MSPLLAFSAAVLAAVVVHELNNGWGAYIVGRIIHISAYWVLSPNVNLPRRAGEDPQRSMAEQWQEEIPSEDKPGWWMSKLYRALGTLYAAWKLNLDYLPEFSPAIALEDMHPFDNTDPVKPISDRLVGFIRHFKRSKLIRYAFLLLGSRVRLDYGLILLGLPGFASICAACPVVKPSSADGTIGSPDKPGFYKFLPMS